MTNKLDLEGVIDSAFDQYLPTLQLLGDWLAQKSYINEFLILACAGLDSLSNLASAQGTQKDCFSKFLLTYSPQRQLFEKVSVPDLYYFLSYHAWVLAGTIEKPGRLHMFDPKRDAPFMRFLWRSRVPLTEGDVHRMLAFLLRVLKGNYRVAPQPKPE
jgi:hypothetical protein